MKTVLYFRLQWRLCQRHADGVFRYARKAGWKVRLIDAGRNTPTARQAIDWWRADGCIADWLFMDRMEWTPDVFGNLPTVFIDASRADPYRFCSSVDHDAVDCVRLVTDELLALDYGDYAYVGTIADFDWESLRRTAFERRMAAAGKRCHVFHPVQTTGFDVFYSELGPWLASLPRPCGIFAANDKVASRVLNACELERIKVPESIAVVGVDDDEMICENAEPTLSSVRPDFEGGGFLAAELLDKIMKRPNRRPERLKYGSQKLVRRNSTRVFRRRDAAGCDRKDELAALYEKRPVKYVFSGRFGDLWRPGWCGLTKETSRKFGVRKAVPSSNAYAGAGKGEMCPEFFTTTAAFHEHLRGFIRSTLEKSGVKDGDWVTFDMEPWGSGMWCHCDECHKAFAVFAGLDHVPSSEEIAAKFADKWALFRCMHNEKSVAIVSRFIREYNPTLKCVDYDYILPYGDEAGMMAKRRACGKDTLENDKWLDGHLCSYYHTIDKAAFLAMRNNVRALKKFYVPMAALCGYGSYLRPGEVLNPRQIRQFALAAFVNGCPGYAFYSGVCYDGEVLLKMMEAQDEIARYEGLPWGRVDGKAEPKCANRQFAFASTVRPNGTEVVALFNYEADETVRVALAGQEFEVEPFGVRFVDVKDVK